MAVAWSYFKRLNDAVYAGITTEYSDTTAQNIFISSDGRIISDYGRVDNGNWAAAVFGENADIGAADGEVFRASHEYTGELWATCGKQILRYKYIQDITDLIISADTADTSDSPIRDISITLRRPDEGTIDDYTTLFCVGSKITVDLMLGDSPKERIITAYCDEHDWSQTDASMKISARNAIGYFLSDATFDDNTRYKGTRKGIIYQMLEYSGIPLYNLIIENDTTEVKYEFKYNDRKFDKIKSLLTEWGWKIAELPNGKVLIGSQTLFNTYAPKGTHTYDKNTQGFEYHIVQRVDSSYSRIAVVSASEETNGEPIIEYRNLSTFRGWGLPKKTKYIDTLAGTPRETVSALADEYKKAYDNIGVTAEILCPVRPNVAPGDLAVFANADLYSYIPRGIITSVRHTYGVSGVMTRLTADSGGTVITAENEGVRTYTAVDVDGDTRRRELLDEINRSASGTVVAYSNLSESGGRKETDPTVPSWAKQPEKPTYTATEVGALSDDTPLFSGRYSDLTGVPTAFAPTSHTHSTAEITDLVIPEIPPSVETAVQSVKIGNNGKELKSGTSVVLPEYPVLPDWVGTQKPTYTASEVGALSDDTPLFSGKYSDLTGVPTTFAPTAHTHSTVDITDLDIPVYTTATSTADGLMSAADKAKLDGLSVSETVLVTPLSEFMSNSSFDFPYYEGVEFGIENDLGYDVDSLIYGGDPVWNFSQTVESGKSYIVSITTRPQSGAEWNNGYIEVLREVLDDIKMRVTSLEERVTALEEGGGGSMQDITITENGVYTPDYPNKGFGVVTVNTEDQWLKRAEMLDYMFYYKSDIDFTRFNIYNAWSISHMFEGCGNLTDMTIDGTRGVSRLYRTFAYCPKLANVTFNCNLGNSFIPSTAGSASFHIDEVFAYSCADVDCLNVHFTKSPYCYRMFRYCYAKNINITTEASLDNAYNFNEAFDSNSKVVSVNLNGIKMYSAINMFRACTSLREVSLDTSLCTNMENMFVECSSLKTLTLSSLRSLSGTGTSSSLKNSFNHYCTALENFTITEENTTVASIDLSYATKLTVESMLSIFNSLKPRDTMQTSSSAYQGVVTLGETNLAKLTDEQKAIATNKNWMLI